MKFTIIALAGALASANARQLRTTTVRKLEGAERAELDGSAIISFAKCIEVSVQSDDADEDTQTAVLAGTAKPVKSFAAFYTNTYANDNEMMMVGLGDYVAAKVKSSAMKAKQACETCRQFEETCNPEEEEVEEEAAEDEEAADEDAAEENADEAEEGDEAAEDGEDAERKLATAIDSSFCYECQANGCYVEEEEDNGQVDYAEQLAQFIENAADCMEIENYADANGNPAYIGMVCGSYGDAAEFAVFMDDECTLETNQVTAATVLSAAGANDEGVSMSQVMSYASMYMQDAFTTSLSCEQVEYYDPNNGDEDGEQNDANEDANAVEMNEACGQIVDEAVYIADCAAEDAAEEDEEDEDEDKWYDFDVQDGGDLDEVCAVVNYKMNIGEDFTYFYDETTQGSVGYDRDMGGHLKSSEAGSGMSGGMIFLIVALVVGIVVAPVAWLINSKKNTQASETDYQGGTLS
eukprot:scaffold248_cov127-Skeletonema_dohrnii-CCMP3373.AAC.1